MPGIASLYYMITPHLYIFSQSRNYTPFGLKKNILTFIAGSEFVESTLHSKTILMALTDSPIRNEDLLGVGNNQFV